MRPSLKRKLNYRQPQFSWFRLLMLLHWCSSQTLPFTSTVLPLKPILPLNGMFGAVAVRLLVPPKT